MTNVENNMYKVEVVKTNGLNKSTKSIRFCFTDKRLGKKFIFRPGQFIMLGVLGCGEVALTITTAVSELPEFEVAVRKAGVGTQALLRLKDHDTAYLRGPLGNSIVTPNVYGKELLLIAGGIGLAPLRSLIRTIGEDKTIAGSLKIFYGAKTPEDLVFKGELNSWAKYAEVNLTVDKADHEWTGKTGRVVDLLVDAGLDRDAVAVVCGPPVMYEAIAKNLLGKGLSGDNILFMLERKMKCGIGKCQHCTCGDKYVCTDGPTFSWSEIRDNWEAFK